jgi:hypothetical protein
MEDIVALIDAAEGEPKKRGPYHDWTKAAADPLFVGAADLWRVMCAAWVEHCANDADCAAVVDPIRDALSDK